MVGNPGSVVKGDFYAKLKELDVQEVLMCIYVLGGEMRS